MVNKEKLKTTRTAAVVPTSKLKTLKEIANLKFDKDPMNKALAEAVDMNIPVYSDHIVSKSHLYFEQKTTVYGKLSKKNRN
jgi:hypothetical protein